MSRPVSIGLAALLTGLAGAALAEDHPPLLPTRDVAVTYNVTARQASGPHEAHLFYSAATQKIRMEAGRQGYAIFDQAAHRLTMVMPQQQICMVSPISPSMSPGVLLNDRMHFVRKGTDTVAGQPCTNWDVTGDRGSGTACVTADGVLLRVEGRDHDGNSAGLLATAVSYAAQPASLFEPPADFHKMDMPAGMPPQAPK